jgi:glycosyltransferase involved in cell wall biosynthesis
MKILFIAPIPPPITGHSKCAQVLYNHLKIENEIKIINLSKNNFNNGKFELKRALQIIKIFFSILKNKRKIDVVYLTISQSLGGNLKDLIIYLLLYNKLAKTYIHLHGGAIKKNLFDTNKVIYKINTFFYNKLGGVIILGQSHKEIFSYQVKEDKLFIVNNFYESIFLLSSTQIINKFNLINSNKIKVLFLSNMQLEKGYNHILDSISLLNSNEANKFEFHFAGKFDNISDEMNFKIKINNSDNIFFHGFIDGKIKKQLLDESHILCLPTEFLEGQPVSIIEAYASGLVVLAPLTGGIIDIFSNANGYPIDSNSISIANTLKKALSDKEQLNKIALFNNTFAKKNFKIDDHLTKINNILKTK